MRKWQRIPFAAALWLAAGVCAAAEAPAVPSVVSGKVFLDANANGKMDHGEKPLPGVRVTDGVNFVTTGADGGKADFKSVRVTALK